MNGDFGSERLVKPDIENQVQVRGIRDTAEKDQEAGWQHGSEKEDRK